MADQTDTGVTITFTGLRDNGYDDKFPSRLGHIFRHVTSHFLPTFIGNRAPTVIVTCEDDTRTYPAEIDSYIFRKEDLPKVSCKRGVRTAVYAAWAVG